MAWTIFTIKQLEDRVGHDLLRRQYDDDRDGDADDDPLELLRKDASSRVVSYLATVMNVQQVVTAAADDTAHEIVRIALDVAEYMACKRHPEVAKGRDWVEMKAAADKDLKQLREGYTRPDTESAPNPSANVGGKVLPAATSSAHRRTFHSGGWGSF